MNEHDDFDDWPELEQLRELHHDDRMPTDVRERVWRRAELPGAPAGSPWGFAATAPSRGSSAEPEPWREPKRALGRKRRPGLLIGAGAALSAAAALALWLRLPAAQIAVESEHPTPLELAARSYTAEELRALGVEPGSSEVRVVGTLVSGSLTRLPPLPPNHRIRCGYHFHLRQPGVSSGDGLHIEYGRCRAPDGLIDDGASCVEVSAVGVIRNDGHLDASRITPRLVTPCTPPR